MSRLPVVSRASITTVLVGAALTGTALYRGGVDPPMVACATLAAVAALLVEVRGGESAPSVRVSALALAFLVVVLGIGIQMLPLPTALVRALSGHTASVHAEVLGPLGVYPSWQAISLDVSATALELGKAVVLALFVLVGVLVTRSDDQRDQVLKAITIAGLVLTAFHLGAAALGTVPLTAPRLTFVNPNHLSAFMQLTAWPALGFALRSHGPRRVAWIAAFAFNSSEVFLSLSRAGISAFAVAVAAFVTLTSGSSRSATEAHRPHRRRSSAKRGSTFVIAIGGALALASWIAVGPVVEQMQTLGDEATMEVKLGLWAPTLRMIRDFPLLGIGRGAYATTFPAYKMEPLQRTFTHVENEWLQFPVDLGIPLGLGIIVACCAVVLAAGRQRPLSRPVAGAVAAVVAVGVHNVFDFSLEIPGVAMPFGIIIGIASRHVTNIEVKASVVRASGLVAGGLGLVGVLLHVTRTPQVETAFSDTVSGSLAVTRAREILPWHVADYVPQAAVGRRLVAEGRCAEAVPWLQRAMVRNPTAPEPHRSMARCLARSRQHELAKSEYRLATMLGDVSALEEAATFYPRAEDLLQVAPDTPDGLFVAGQLMKSDPAAASEAWMRGWTVFRDVRALRELAIAKLQLLAPDEALALAREAETADDRNPTGFIIAAQALDTLGRSDDAFRELEIGVARYPGNADLLARLGMRRLSERRYSQAKAIFEKIVARDPETLSHKHVLIANALEGQGRLIEAVREAATAREIAPSSLRALITFARVAAALRRFDDAIEAMERVVKLDPSQEAAAHLETLRAERSAPR